MASGHMSEQEINDSHSGLAISGSITDDGCIPSGWPSHLPSCSAHDEIGASLPMPAETQRQDSDETPVYRSLPSRLDLAAFEWLSLQPAPADQTCTPDCQDKSLPSCRINGMNRPPSVTAINLMAAQAADEAPPVTTLELPFDLFNQILSHLTPHPGARLAASLSARLSRLPPRHLASLSARVQSHARG
jgi:hypothetical protein